MTQFTNTTLNDIPNSVWMHIIQHSNDFAWNFLALKIILTRLKLKLAMAQDGEDTEQQCCNELKNLLQKSANIPNAQKDVDQILTIKAQVNL